MGVGEGLEEGRDMETYFLFFAELYPDRTKLNSESQEHLITSHLKGCGQP